MDPFAAALDALFNAPGSLEASYQQGDGWSRPIRVIRSQPDRDVGFGAGRAIQATNVFEIMRSEVERPAHGDLIIIGFDIFELLGDPALDVEGLTWTCGAAPKV